MQCGTRNLRATPRFAHVEKAGLMAPQNLLQRLVYFHMAVVADVTALPEQVHEKVDARTYSADHLRQDLIT